MSDQAETSLADKSRREEALQEYLLTQTAIREYDNRSFQIKSWSITVMAAAAAGGLAQQMPTFFLLAASASIAFWLVDALWKSFQVVWIKRGTELEVLLSGEGPLKYSGPGVHASFRKRFKSPISWLYLVPCMFKANVYLPHLPAAAVLAIYYWSLIGWRGLHSFLGSTG